MSRVSGVVRFVILGLFRADKLAVHLFEQAFDHVVHPSWRNIVRLSSDPRVHRRIDRRSAAGCFIRFRFRHDAIFRFPAGGRPMSVLRFGYFTRRRGDAEFKHSSEATFA